MAYRLDQTRAESLPAVGRVDGDFLQMWHPVDDLDRSETHGQPVRRYGDPDLVLRLQRLEQLQREGAKLSSEVEAHFSKQGSGGAFNFVEEG